MIQLTRWLRSITMAMGLICLAFLTFDFFFLIPLRERMIVFEPVSAGELNVLTAIGFGFLFYMGFYLLSLLLIVEAQRRRQSLSFGTVGLILLGILGFVTSFSDVALLTDIVNQHENGFAQPEWNLLFPILAFQVLVALAILRQQLRTNSADEMSIPAKRDSNVFLLVQYVGILCGVLGLVAASLGFRYPRAWKPNIHTVYSLIVLCSPYALAVGYWFLIKLREKQREWYDEKQILDLGRSAFLTLIASTLVMTALFITHFSRLDAALAQLWFPTYLFGVLLFFSAGNLYCSWRG